MTLDLYLLPLIKNIYGRNPTYFARTKPTNYFLFNLDIFSTPTNIALDSLLVFCIRSDFLSTNIPLLRIEIRVREASAIMSVATMQKITTPSVMDVIGFKKFLLLSMENSCPSLSTN